jgi:hypothetical protein
VNRTVGEPLRLDLQDGQLIQRPPADVSARTRPRRGCPADRRSSADIRSNTPSHPSLRPGRNSLSDGYHGVSSRPRSQRQSATAPNATQHGIPTAPAR